MTLPKTNAEEMPPSGSEWIDLGGGIEAEVALETSSAWHVRALHQGGVALTWQHAIEELEAGRLGVQLSDLISRSPHAACFWETAPITSATAGSTRFSFVTLPAPHLAQASPDEHSFAKHFARCAAGGAVHFKSLGGDATLVAPCPTRGISPGVYAHLGAFVRGAPSSQQATLWRELGGTIRKTLDKCAVHEPMWVSTERSGVSWLHVRLDSRPKYFHHKPFRRPPHRR